MKIFLPLFVISLLLLTACSKEDTKLEAFNPEAFAYDSGKYLGSNATINVKDSSREKAAEILSKHQYLILPNENPGWKNGRKLIFR